MRPKTSKRTVKSSGAFRAVGKSKLREPYLKFYFHEEGIKEEGDRKSRAGEKMTARSRNAAACGRERTAYVIKIDSAAEFNYDQLDVH